MSPVCLSGFREAHSLPTASIRNTVQCGDCVSIMARMPAGSIDLILTDPPYLVAYRDRHGRTVANDNDPAWLLPAFAQMYRVLKQDALCMSFYAWNRADVFIEA